MNSSLATDTYLDDARSPISRFERFLFVAAFGLLVSARLPRVWSQGRFWAEEGHPFFENAWNLHWWQAVFTVHIGYLNLVANGAAVLAYHLASLRYAPYVPSILALGFSSFRQSCWRPAILPGCATVMSWWPLCSSSRLLQRPRRCGSHRSPAISCSRSALRSSSHWRPKPGPGCMGFAAYRCCSVR